MINSTNPAYQALLQSSQDIFSSNQTNQADFTLRKIRTRTKEKPKSDDLRKINSAVEELMVQNSMSPENDPFNYLSMANVFYMHWVMHFCKWKGGKKQRNDIPETISKIRKEKRVYEEKVKSIIAKVELEKIKENKKDHKDRKEKRN